MSEPLSTVTKRDDVFFALTYCASDPERSHGPDPQSQEKASHA